MLRHGMVAAPHRTVQAVRFSSGASGAGETPSDGAVSFSYTIPAGANLLLVGVAVGVSYTHPNSYAAFTRSVTFDGTPLTSLGAVNGNNESTGFVELFYMEDPPITGVAKTIAVSVTGAALDLVIGEAVSYSNVVSVGTGVTAAGLGAGTVTVPSGSGHIVAAVMGSGSSISGVTDRSRYLNNLSGSFGIGCMLMQDQDGETSAVLGFGNNSDKYAIVAVDLLGSGGGGGGGNGEEWVPDESKVIFKGDFSTNNFSQWALAQTKFYNNTGPGYDQYCAQNGTPYSIAIVNDATYGKAARFELRPGDHVNDANTERDEIGSNTLGGEGDVLWLEFAVKFGAGAEAWPTTEPSFQHVTQFHSDGAAGPMGMWTSRIPGYFSLNIAVMDANHNVLGSNPIWHAPLERGVWHHITQRWVISRDPALSSIQLWHNQIRQTFLNNQTTYQDPNYSSLSQDATHVYYKQGIYRVNFNTTNVAYLAAARVCSAMTGLTRPVY